MPPSSWSSFAGAETFRGQPAGADSSVGATVPHVNTLNVTMNGDGSAAQNGNGAAVGPGPSKAHPGHSVASSSTSSAENSPVEGISAARNGSSDSLSDDGCTADEGIGTGGRGGSK